MRILTFSLALCGVLLSACSKSTAPYSVDVDSAIQVPMGSKDITLDSYSSGKIEILLEPGNRNPDMSWATLYSQMPGEDPKYTQVPNPQVPAPGTTANGDDDENDGAGTSAAPPTITKVSDGSSTKKTFEPWAKDPVGLRAELDRRFNKALKSILKDKNLKFQLEKAGANFQIDPVLILGCVVGENTFNVGLLDDVQRLATLSAKWGATWALKFKSNKTDLAVLIRRPEFSTCAAGLASGGDQATYWRCVAKTWNTQFAGKTINGEKFESNGFRMAFFNPLGVGLTYGLGQLDPIRALMVTDMVNKQSGFRFLTIDRPAEIYEDIINQNTNVHYVGANVRLMIDTYRTRARYDISRNPGVIASLYNMGREDERADKLFARNVARLGKKLKEIPPRENYYGFYINEREADLRRIYQNWKL